VPADMYAITVYHTLHTAGPHVWNSLPSAAQSQTMWAVTCKVTTCLENLEMSLNLTAVREMSDILLKVSKMSENCQGKNLVVEKLPKTVYCKLHICIHTGIYHLYGHDMSNI